MSDTELSQLTMNNSVCVYKLGGGGLVPGTVFKKPSSRNSNNNEEEGQAITTFTTVNEVELSKLIISDTISTTLNSSDVPAVPAVTSCYVCGKCASVLFSSDHLVYRHDMGSDTPSTTPVEYTPSVPPNASVYCTAIYYLPSSLLGCCNGLYKDSLINKQYHVIVV